MLVQSISTALIRAWSDVMQFTAWNNGSNGYGFKVAISDRGALFDQSWNR